MLARRFLKVRRFLDQSFDLTSREYFRDERPDVISTAYYLFPVEEVRLRKKLSCQKCEGIILIEWHFVDSKMSLFESRRRNGKFSEEDVRVLYMRYLGRFLSHLFSVSQSGVINAKGISFSLLVFNLARIIGFEYDSIFYWQFPRWTPNITLDKEFGFRLLRVELDCFF